MHRFLLLKVIHPHYHQEWAIQDMLELEQLVATYGGMVIEKSVQHRSKPNPSTYIGSGKLEWVQEVVKQQDIDVVVLNDIVNSGQLFRLERTLWKINPSIQVWDRVDLILHIFDQHAKTTEAKLQIELARIQHTGPRIYGLGKTELSRQGGGIGTRGKGETNIEIERRVIKKRVQQIRQELKQRAKVQEKRLQQRKYLGMKTVALVGYTSAGKTTLFNALTSKHKEMSQELFTTLDSVVGKLKRAPHAPTILVSDTIGFINDLPPILIEAFRSTLMESVTSEVLLHLVDASDEHAEDKIAVVEKILGELGVSREPILVFNKVDMASLEHLRKLKQQYADRQVLFVSAKTTEGVPELKQVMSARLFGNSHLSLRPEETQL